jgi:toxin secretion/phage lysis holin
MPVMNYLREDTKEASKEVGYHLYGIFSSPFIKIPVGVLVAMFGQVYTFIHILLGLVFIDILAGMSVSIKNRRFSSYGFARGIWKFLAYIFTIFAVRLIEMGAFNNSYTFTNLMIGILCITEGISILENAILLGVPLPRQFMDLIKKQERYKLKECNNGKRINRPKGRKIR